MECITWHNEKHKNCLQYPYKCMSLKKSHILSWRYLLENQDLGPQIFYATKSIKTCWLQGLCEVPSWDHRNTERSLCKKTSNYEAEINAITAPVDKC